jgi:hypothetical protein
MTGEGLPLLVDLVDRGIIRILDLVFVKKELDEAGGVLEPGSSAGLLVYENRWAASFASALRRGGGQVVASGRIPVQDMLAALDATESSSSS